MHSRKNALQLLHLGAHLCIHSRDHARHTVNPRQNRRHHTLNTSIDGSKHRLHRIRNRFDNRIQRNKNLPQPVKKRRHSRSTQITQSALNILHSALKRLTRRLRSTTHAKLHRSRKRGKINLPLRHHLRHLSRRFTRLPSKQRQHRNTRHSKLQHVIALQLTASHHRRKNSARILKRLTRNIRHIGDSLQHIRHLPARLHARSRQRRSRRRRITQRIRRTSHSLNSRIHNRRRIRRRVTQTSQFSLSLINSHRPSNTATNSHIIDRLEALLSNIDGTHHCSATQSQLHALSKKTTRTLTLSRHHPRKLFTNIRLQTRHLRIQRHICGSNLTRHTLFTPTHQSRETPRHRHEHAPKYRPPAQT